MIKKINKAVNISLQEYYDQNYFGLSPQNTALIRIQNIGTNFINHRNIFKKQISLQFDDTIDLRGFTKHHARLLIDFIKGAKENNLDLLCHCEAGINRSPEIINWACNNFDYTPHRLKQNYHGLKYLSDYLDLILNPIITPEISTHSNFN